MSGKVALFGATAPPLSLPMTTGSADSAVPSAIRVFTAFFARRRHARAHATKIGIAVQIAAADRAVGANACCGTRHKQREYSDCGQSSGQYDRPMSYAAPRLPVLDASHPAFDPV